MRVYLRDRYGNLRSLAAPSLAHARNGQAHVTHVLRLPCFIVIDGGKR